VSPIVIGPLILAVGQHRLVETTTIVLGRVALSLVLVIIDAVNVYDPLVVLSRVTLNLDDVLIWPSLNLSLAVVTTAVKN